MIVDRARRTDPVHPAKQLMTVPFENAVGSNANARVVEFIAKPNKTDELRSFLSQSARKFLGDQTGLIGLVVLTFCEEPRRVMVMTFWRTEELAALGTWEETPMVRELLSPLIDSWSSIRTYKVDLPEAADAYCRAIGFPPQPSTASNSLCGTARP
jgi:heme-degrading monooxygenase HmoA